MSPIHVVHLVSVSMWAGLVLAETVVEIAGERDDAARAHAAKLHFWMDALVELPLLAVIVTTGAILVARTPMSTELLVKIGAGAIAISANLYCAVVVVVRYRKRAERAVVQRLGWPIRASAIGIPFAAVAAYIGLARLLA